MYLKNLTIDLSLLILLSFFKIALKVRNYFVIFKNKIKPPLKYVPGKIKPNLLGRANLSVPAGIPSERRRTLQRGMISRVVQEDSWKSKLRLWSQKGNQNRRPRNKALEIPRQQLIDRNGKYEFSRRFHSIQTVYRILNLILLSPLQFSISAINDTESKGQWEPLAPTKEAQVSRLSPPFFLFLFLFFSILSLSFALLPFHSSRNVWLFVSCLCCLQVIIGRSFYRNLIGHNDIK